MVDGPSSPNGQMPPNALGSPSSSSKSGKNGAHVDVDEVLEDHVWAQFLDLQSLKKTRLDEFINLPREDCEFEINRRHLIVLNEEPQYGHFQPSGAKPYTLFKSIYTNNTDRQQDYSFKTERTTESLCAVQREQGHCFGAEAELTLKTPCEIAELKAGFKHEVHFNKLTENTQTEILSWGVDSTVTVPPHYMTEASVVIEELNYRGTYQMATILQGAATVSIRRRRDNALVLPVRVDIVEAFRELLQSPTCRKAIKAVVSVDERNRAVKLLSKGSCQFQFAMKQRIDLREEPIRTSSTYVSAYPTSRAH